MHQLGISANINLLADTPEAKQGLFAAFKDKDQPAIRAALSVFNNGMKTYGDMMLQNSRGQVILPANIAAGLSQAGNFPAQPPRVVQVFFTSSEEPADTTWSALSVVDDFRGTNESNFSLGTVTNAISFRSYLNGEKVELFSISGTEAAFPFELIGGGFHWLQTWLDDNKWWTLAQGFAEAATQYAKEVAENFYAVLTAASGLVTETRVSTPASQPAAYYDITTINNAYVNILALMRTNSGYGAPNPRMYLVYNSLEVALATRIAQIFAPSGFILADQGTVAINPNISPLGSPNVPAGSAYLVLPGRKIRTGWRMDMTGYDHFDIFSYSGARVFWGRYTHVRGDSAQVRIIPLS